MSALARLLEQAPMTGPRIFTLEQQRDMARLLLDAMAWVASVRDEAIRDREPDYLRMDELLARFAELEQRAAP